MSPVPSAIDPGIVVLSSSLQLLHVNHQAISLLKQVQDTTAQADADLNLTAPLHAHGLDIIMAMRERLVSHDFTPFHCYRAVGRPAQRILLKGFGLPDQRGFHHSRIVMLLVPQSGQEHPRR